MRSLKPLSPLIVLLWFCCSCASLTQSQLDEVNQFGKSTKTFSVYPGKVMSTLAEIHMQNEYFQTNIANAELRRQQVDSIYLSVQTAAKNDSLINLAFETLSDYGQKLVHLTANIHTLQLDTAAQSFGGNLDSLVAKFNSLDPKHAIPTGYGALIGKVLDFGVDLYIQDRQAKGARAFVTKGDTLVAVMAQKLEEFIDSDDFLGVKAAIKRERKNLVRNYTAYLANDHELIRINIEKDIPHKKDRQWKKDTVVKKDTVITGDLRAWRSSGMGADSLYFRLKTNLDLDETLRKQCLAAVSSLRAAHHKLLADLREKKKLKEVYAEMQAYSASLNKMYATFKKIK